MRFSDLRTKVMVIVSAVLWFVVVTLPNVIIDWHKAWEIIQHWLN